MNDANRNELKNDAARARGRETARPAGEPAQPPAVLRYGAAVVLLQCAALFAYAIFLVVSQFTSHDSTLESASPAAHYVNLGTAAFLFIVFGFVGHAAWTILRGEPRATGAIVLAEAILIGVSFYMFRGGVPLLGTATLLSAVLALVGIFHPQSTAYNEARYAERKARR